MFICSDCCKKCKDVFNECWIRFIGPKSFGPCEECGHTAVCVDCIGMPTMEWERPKGHSSLFWNEYLSSKKEAEEGV